MKSSSTPIRLLTIATAAICMASVAGCGEAVTSSGARKTPGEVTTTRAPDRSSSARTPRATPSATKTVARPWKVTLKKADSCRIARAIPPKRFKSSGGKIDGSGSLIFSGNVACSRLARHPESDVYYHDPGILLEVTAVVDRGLDEGLSMVNVKGLVDRRLTVDGFPALVVKSPPKGRGCNGFLDVADGQFVYVLLAQPFDTPDDKTAVPPATLCKRVPGVLSAVLEQLRPHS